MARISLDHETTPLYRLVQWYSKRHYGAMLDPGKALWHNRRVLWAELRFEQAIAKFDTLDPVLKHLAVMAAAARIGCSWCLDFGYWEASRLGIPAEKVRAVPSWRDHRQLFSETEQAVLAYAEAMCETEPTVTDDLAAQVRARLGDAAFVELTVMVGVENLRSRVNSALGLRSQGFADHCEVPEVAIPAVASRR